MVEEYEGVAYDSGEKTDRAVDAVSADLEVSETT
jgi:hypothetical protein